MGDEIVEYTFYDVGQTVQYQQVPEVEAGNLFTTIIYLSDEMTFFSRQIYSILDLLGEFGGITEVVMLLSGFYLYSISEHSFVIKALQKLFIARTSNKRLFKAPKTKKQLQKLEKLVSQEHSKGNLTESVKLEELQQKHYEIRLSTKDSTVLYFNNLFASVGCKCLDRCTNQSRLQKLFEEGNDRLEKEFNMVKLIRNLRNIKILMKNSFMSEKIKYEIKHSDFNLINLSSDDDEHDVQNELNIVPENILLSLTQKIVKAKRAEKRSKEESTMTPE